MEKERIMVDGIKYRYIINDSNEIELNKDVSKDVFNKIKNTLIKKIPTSKKESWYILILIMLF